jgi:hypothetical protein
MGKEVKEWVNVRIGLCGRSLRIGVRHPFGGGVALALLLIRVGLDRWSDNREVGDVLVYDATKAKC